MEHTKNAELSVEQNYNHIDGLNNNLPIQPPERENTRTGSLLRNQRRYLHLHSRRLYRCHYGASVSG